MSEVAATLVTDTVRPRSTFRRTITHSSGRIGVAILVVLIAGALFVPVFFKSSVDAVSFRDALALPSLAHPLGADQLGRDLLARVLAAGRVSMLIGLLATMFGMVIGVLVGAVSGYFGGTYDFIIQRLTDALLSLPSLVLALALVAGLGTGTMNVVVAVGIASIPGFVRVARGQTLIIRETGFVAAAVALGVPSRTILWRHVLPHLWPIIVVQATAQLGGAILTVASLGFLGLGVPPSVPEWGSMAAQGRDLIFSHPHVVTIPGMAISLAVLAFNLLGDAIRDALDPRLKDK